MAQTTRSRIIRTLERHQEADYVCTCGEVAPASGWVGTAYRAHLADKLLAIFAPKETWDDEARNWVAERMGVDK
jgi:hypothetical protein